MLTVISPAKTLNFESETSSKQTSQASFLEDSQRLVDLMKKKGPKDLKSLMGVSDKLAALNFHRFKNWSADHNNGDSRQSIFAFMGDVYIGLDAYTLERGTLKYAQNHLRILSGLYGLLKPLDLIQPYRLEMGTKLENSRGKNLYKFWGTKLTVAINKQAKKINTKYLVNLASKEYFSAVEKTALELAIITPIFKDWTKDGYRVQAFHAKKARGLMARFILENKIQTRDELELFDVSGYHYDRNSSNESEIVFTRKP